MSCQCSVAGYCATHRRMMCETRFNECRTKPGYFEVFQEDLMINGPKDPRGLGDTVKRMTDKTGIAKLAKLYAKITGNSCGCTGRQARWNKWFRYKEFVSVAITTAPRRESYLQSTLASVVRNKVEPIIFAEPNSDLAGVGQLKIIRNSERLGAWHNWVHSCRYLLDHTKSDFILTVQDDTLIADGAVEFLKSIEWPSDCGMISLYTPTQYTRRTPGLHKITTRSLWGACAMLFKRDQLQRLLDTKVAQHWQGASFRTRKRPREPWEIANVDTAVGKALTRLDLFPYFFSPSLSQHIGAESSIGHKGMGPKRVAKTVVVDYSVFPGRESQ